MQFEVEKQAVEMTKYSKYKTDTGSLTDKKYFIRGMFDSIASKYDTLNRVLSFSIDNLWRRDLVRIIAGYPGIKILDICCGTGDLSRQLLKSGADLFSLDFSFNMLKKGIDKGWLTGANISGDAAKLPFKDKGFDFLTIAFGIRNIPDIDIFLSESFRVLKPDGMLLILELTRPDNRFIFYIYKFYLTKIIPVMGWIISGQKDAYYYLGDTILSFLDKEILTEKIKVSGFKQVEYKKKTFGIAAIYKAVRS